MKIQNLSSEELQQLQMLLNKMNPIHSVNLTHEMNPVDRMINDIIENFDFGKVQTVMFKLNWQWGSEGVPTIERLKEQALYLLKKAAELRLGEYKYEHSELGIISGTGGFQATAYCNDSKTEIIYFKLQFILEEWDSEIEED